MYGKNVSLQNNHKEYHLKRIIMETTDVINI